VAYHKAITKDTGPVRAEGTIVTMGRRAVFTDARLVDVHGRLYASATSSLLVMHPT
jgi:acyl-coenzyme A thioesterase PaaI-like protein